MDQNENRELSSQNPNPLVSVVIPAYNHEKFIGATIESVLNQSFQNFEIVVVDDGSTDRTAEVVQNYDDCRIIYVHQKNQDAYNAINRGMGMARGNFISILNSDDVYASNRLERLLEIQKQTGALCLFSDVTPIDDSGDVFDDPLFGWNQWHQKNRSYYFQTRDLYTAFLNGNFMVTTSNLFMHRDAVARVGNFCSLRYLHDYDYIFRMMLAFPDRVKYLHDEKLLFYRIHSGNTLNQAAIIGREQDQMVIRRYMLKKVPERHRSRISWLLNRLLRIEKKLIRTHISAYPHFSQKVRKYLRLWLLEARRDVIRSMLFNSSLGRLRPIIKAGSERLVELEYELFEVAAILEGNPVLVERKTMSLLDILKKLKFFRYES